MTKWRRFLLGFLLASFISAPIGFNATVQAKEAPCHPATCHSWTDSDWQWWTFGCYNPHCPSCGW